MKCFDRWPGPQKAQKAQNKRRVAGFLTPASLPDRRNCLAKGSGASKNARILQIIAGIRIASQSRMFNIPNPPSPDPRTYAIIGAAYEVHRILGTGFLEIFYKDALEIELTAREVPYQREVACSIEYKGHALSRDYHMDFVCFDDIVVEVKARSVTGPADHAQVLSYLASSKKRYGLLINFGTAKLEHRRFIWEPPLER